MCENKELKSLLLAGKVITKLNLRVRTLDTKLLNCLRNRISAETVVMVQDILPDGNNHFKDKL